MNDKEKIIENFESYWQIYYSTYKGDDVSFVKTYFVNLLQQERQAKKELVEALEKSNQYLIEDQKLSFTADRLNQPQIDQNILFIEKHKEK